MSNDKLTAVIYLLGKNDSVEVDEIYQELERAGVKFGILEDAILRFSVFPTREPVVVARGVPPVPGRDGHLEVLYGKNQDKLPGLEDDVVDFRETSKIVSVEAGSPLVEVHPPIPGEEGIAVTGEAIKPPAPKEIKLQAGKGVALNREGTRAVAQVNGRPWVREAGLLKVINCDPVYIHGGNVDIKTGNLRFKGDVKILGDVCEAMEVQVTGDLEVQGLVTMARVISGGKIIVFGNVINSRLRAGILFPGAKKLAFIMGDLHTELENLAIALRHLKSKKIIDFELVDFNRVALGLLDSRFKNIRPMVKNVQAFVKNKMEELPQEVIEAINSLNCFTGLKTLTEKEFENVFREMSTAVELLSHSKVEGSASTIIKSAVNSVIQSAGNFTVTGQGCLNTNITAAGNVYIRGSFKGGEILCEGNADIYELGSSLGVPPVVRVAAKSNIKINKAREGSVIQVGNRRVTLTKDINSFRAKLNRDEQLELY